MLVDKATITSTIISKAVETISSEKIGAITVVVARELKQG
jgi:hypothetical protein